MQLKTFVVFLAAIATSSLVAAHPIDNAALAEGGPAKGA